MMNPLHPGVIVLEECIKPLPRVNGRPGGRGAGREPVGVVPIDQRACRRVGRDGDPPVEGLRLHAGNLVEDADALRPRANPGKG